MANYQINSNDLEFKKFLKGVQSAEFEHNTTITGTTTIQQTSRNNLRRQGLAALKEDLIVLYGDEFDIVETEAGLVIVTENEADGTTFSWELKSTIKSVDYDPFLDADRWEAKCEATAAKKARIAAEKETKAKLLAAKREAKLREFEARSAE